MKETLKLLEEHPNVTKLIISWFAKKLEKGMKNENVTEEIKEFMRSSAITNEIISGIFNDSPRSLFDFFDENKIYINIIKDNDGFYYNINKKEGQKRDQFSTRILADRAAISEAFKILETKLFN